ncbi:MAG TPA: phosphorylase [Terriglobales bacterium]|jgi:adenosylhomocysteine nucleosidase|nr:phosphorylase [Terriglobales bacterium]
MATPKIGIVAALEREVWSLIKYWSKRRVQDGGNEYELFDNGHAVLVCSGIGRGPARVGAEALIKHVPVGLMISAGYAGALASGIAAGAPFVPAEVVDAESGARYNTRGGNGVLLSAGHVLGKEEKAQLALQYGAQAVDMEAATVAEVARERGIGFHAIKAISEEKDFDMPPVEKFVDERGRFQTGRFVLHTAVRPAGWAAAGQLAAKAARASRTLCDLLMEMVRSEAAAGGNGSS